MRTFVSKCHKKKKKKTTPNQRTKFSWRSLSFSNAILELVSAAVRAAFALTAAISLAQSLRNLVSYVHF